MTDPVFHGHDDPKFHAYVNECDKVFTDCMDRIRILEKEQGRTNRATVEWLFRRMHELKGCANYYLAGTLEVYRIRTHDQSVKSQANARKKNDQQDTD